MLDDSLRNWRVPGHIFATPLETRSELIEWIFLEKKKNVGVGNLIG